MGDLPPFGNLINRSIFTGNLLILKFKHQSIFIGDLPIQIQTLVYFYRRLAIFQIPKRTSANVHASLKVVYFHRQPTHSNSNTNIFLQATCHFSNSKKNFSKRPCFSESGLFSQATYPFEIKKLVYFHGRLALFKLKKELQ